MRLLVAVTGASGVVYGKRLLEVLADKEDVTVELVVSNSAKILIREELGGTVDELEASADVSYDYDEMKAPPASGSTLYDAMVVVPCSISTLSKIANGIADNLITRAAAVTLKERRKMVLVPRETPLSTGTLKNMYELSSQGVVILPAVPGFYGEPEEIMDLVDFVVGRLLDSLGVDNDIYKRWGQ